MLPFKICCKFAILGLLSELWASQNNFSVTGATISTAFRDALGVKGPGTTRRERSALAASPGTLNAELDDSNSKGVLTLEAQESAMTGDHSDRGGIDEEGLVHRREGSATGLDTNGLEELENDRRMLTDAKTQDADPAERANVNNTEPNSVSVVRQFQSVIPVNPLIPDNDLARISLELLPIIVQKYNIPVLSRHATAPHSQQCRDNPLGRHPKGCSMAVFIVDADYSGDAFWIFRRQCSCKSSGFIKLTECTTKIDSFPLAELSGNWTHLETEVVNFPIGECRTALWVWLAVALASLFIAVTLSWFIAATVLRRQF